MKLPSQSGFSLVSIVISLGVLSTLLLFLSQKQVQHFKRQKHLETKSADKDLVRSLQNTVASHFNTNMSATNCIDVQRLNIPLGGSSAIRFTSNIDLNNFQSAPASAKIAAAKCKSILSPAAANNPNQNVFEFCAEITPDGSSPRHSPLNSKRSFAHVKIELLNLQTLQPISCYEYQALKRIGGQGMNITTDLHWIDSTKNNPIFAFVKESSFASY